MCLIFWCLWCFGGWYQGPAGVLMFLVFWGFWCLLGVLGSLGSLRYLCLLGLLGLCGLWDLWGIWGPWSLCGPWGPWGQWDHQQGVLLTSKWSISSATKAKQALWYTFGYLEEFCTVSKARQRPTKGWLIAINFAAHTWVMMSRSPIVKFALIDIHSRELALLVSWKPALYMSGTC